MTGAVMGEMRLALRSSATGTSHLNRLILRQSGFPHAQEASPVADNFHLFSYVRYQTDFALANFYKWTQGNSDRASIALASTSLQRPAASTGEASMTQPAAIPAKKVTHFAHQALKAPVVANLEPLFKRSHAQPPLLTTGLPGVAAEATDLSGAGDLQISIEDWDLLFRSIQWRLGAAVGARLASAPAPQADGRADPVQVSVLECISAMEQLHAALTLERQNRMRTNPNANGRSVNTEAVLFAGKLG